MDAAQLGSLDVAREKAYSTVAFRRPTKVFSDLVVDGKLIGAVGVSGVTAQQDAQIARAGIEALK